MVLTFSKVSASMVKDLAMVPWHFPGDSNSHGLFDREDLSWAVQARGRIVNVAVVLLQRLRSSHN